MNAKVFLSDEGYGHIVRQSAVINALKEFDSSIDFTIQTHKHIDFVKEIISDVKLIDKFNNIKWHRHDSGSPNISAINTYYNNYLDIAKTYMAAEQKSIAQYDFIISDFVYEPFKVAKDSKIKAYGVAHFTWDWFFSKLYPRAIEQQIQKHFTQCGLAATKIFFPPFTPQEILNYYKNSVKVPFIIRKGINLKKVAANKKFKIMFIDSGAGVLNKSIKKSLKQLEKIDEYSFYVSESFPGAFKNVIKIPKEHLLVDYIHDMDLVIGRAGFNTISECITFRTPMLLIGEAMNPEMSENILNLLSSGLGFFISLNELENGLNKFLPNFIKRNYKTIKSKMDNHNLATNGAEIIAKHILNDLK